MIRGQQLHASTCEELWMTVTDRIRDTSFLYDAEFPPTVEEGRRLRETKPGVPGPLGRLRRLLRRVRLGR